VVVTAVGSVVAFSTELQAALLFQISPGFASRRYLLRLENADGQTVHLLGTIHTQHLDRPEYSLWHLAAFIDHIKPNLVLRGELLRAGCPCRCVRVAVLARCDIQTHP